MRNLVLVSQFERFLYFLSLICSTNILRGRSNQHRRCMNPNQIAIQATAQMAADKEAVSLSRAHIQFNALLYTNKAFRPYIKSAMQRSINLHT